MVAKAAEIIKHHDYNPKEISVYSLKIIDI